MHHNILRLTAILAVFPLSAIAEEASAQACAKALSPAARLIYDATAASQPPDSALRLLLTFYGLILVNESSLPYIGRWIDKTGLIYRVTDNKNSQ